MDGAAPAATASEKEDSKNVSASPDAPAPSDFFKGDLIYPGTRRLLSRYDHAGVAFGPNVVGLDVFLSVDPGFAFYSDTGVSVAMHAPLRLLAFDGGQLAYGGMKVRRQDWDEVSDYMRVIRFITYGRKEGSIYATINTMRPTTLGHGMLINRYQGDIDVDRSLTGFAFDAYNKFGGFELQANDITFRNKIMGGLAFIKPLSFFSDDINAQSLSIGGEYVADFAAPGCVNKSASDNTCVRGTGHAAGADPYGGAGLDDTFVRTDPDTGRFDVQTTTVHAAGVSAEYKVYKDERNIDIKLYTTWHKFLNDGGGSGMAVGALARLNTGDAWRNALRIRTEYRNFGNGFLPNYFDSMYEIQKYAYLYRRRDYQVTPTKAQYVFGDPANGFERLDFGRRHGFSADASWGLFKEKRSDKKIALGAGLSDSTGPDDTNFYLHAG